MITTVLFDGDGILVNKPFRFSDRFSKEYGVPMKKLLAFFENDFQPCLIGKADLKEVLRPYLAPWGWTKSVDDLLQYWFKSEHYRDEEVIKSIQQLRERGIACHFSTNQEKYRMEYMKKEMGFGSVFDQFFSSADLGYKKPDVKFWETIFERLQPIDKDNVLVWDDKIENVNSAVAFGFQTELYKDYGSYKKKMSALQLTK